ncbi:MAG: hypothetical protein RL479_2519 [Verrucomicrobiota bacterium]
MRTPPLTGHPYLAKLAKMETTVLKAKNNLSDLLRRAERGEEIIIRRGPRGRAFRLSPVRERSRRSLTPNPRWVQGIAFKDEDIWASEWREGA